MWSSKIVKYQVHVDIHAQEPARLLPCAPAPRPHKVLDLRRAESADLNTTTSPTYSSRIMANHNLAPDLQRQMEQLELNFYRNQGGQSQQQHPQPPVPQPYGYGNQPPPQYGYAPLQQPIPANMPHYGGYGQHFAPQPTYGQQYAPPTGYGQQHGPPQAYGQHYTVPQAYTQPQPPPQGNGQAYGAAQGFGQHMPQQTHAPVAQGNAGQPYTQAPASFAPSQPTAQPESVMEWYEKMKREVTAEDQAEVKAAMVPHQTPQAAHTPSDPPPAATAEPTPIALALAGYRAPQPIAPRPAAATSASLVRRGRKKLAEQNMVAHTQAPSGQAANSTPQLPHLQQPPATRPPQHQPQQPQPQQQR